MQWIVRILGDHSLAMGLVAVVSNTNVGIGRLDMLAQGNTPASS